MNNYRYPLTKDDIILRKDEEKIYIYKDEYMKWSRAAKLDGDRFYAMYATEDEATIVRKELSICLSKQLLTFYGVDNIVKDVVVKICQAFCDVNRKLFSLASSS